MQLLEAVNKVLRSIGESPVSTITTSHPEVVGIIDAVKQATERRQRRGWWFNINTVTLPAPPALPAGTSFARAINTGLRVYPKGDVLHDRNTGLPFVGDPGPLEVQTLVQFEDLPESFAEYVVLAASVDYGISYDADELHLKALQIELEESRVQVHRLHIRYFEIDKASRIIQGRGWWFNKYRATLTPGPTGEVEVAPDVLYAKPMQRHLDYFPRGARLIDRRGGEPVKHAVECDVRVYVQFDDLPQSMKDYVNAAAELQRAQDYLPESSSIPRLQAEVQQARYNAQQDHIKYAGVNLFSINSVGVPLARGWGSRYRRH